MGLSKDPDIRARQLENLAAGRAKRGTGAGRPRKKTPAAQAFDAIEDTLEQEGLIEDFTPPKRKPRAKLKADEWVTAEAALTGGLVLNFIVTAALGEKRQMTNEEAAGVVAPIMRIATRRLLPVLERILPGDIDTLESGDKRDITASLLAMGSYLGRQAMTALGEWYERMERKRNGAGGASPMPPPQQEPAFTPDDTAPAPGPVSTNGHAPSWVPDGMAIPTFRGDV